MPEEFASTSPHSTRSNEKQFETQVTLLGSLLFMSLSVCSFTLGELSQGAYGLTLQVPELNAFPLTLVSGALGAFVGFLFCNLLTDAFRVTKNLHIAFLLAVIALVMGFLGTLTNISLAAAFIGLSLAFLYILWIRLSIPVASHSFFVIALALAIVVPGAFGSFANVTSTLDRQNLLLLALCFSLASCFFTFLLHFGTSETLAQLPDRQTSILRSRSISTTFRPALIDGFILGLCLRNYCEGAVLNLPVGMSIGFALILSACLSCLQLIPRSNYEKFVRNHASSFKVIPLLLPVLFGSEFLLITSAISLCIAVAYTMFLMTSLNDRMLLLELSPFYTYGTHGAVFFPSMVAGIIAMPIFSLIHIDAPFWCRAIFLIVFVGMEWLLVGTINRKSYIDPESNHLTAREKVTESLPNSKGNTLDVPSASDKENSKAYAQNRSPQTTGEESASGDQASPSSNDANAQAQNSMSRWSNHIRMMADMYGLSARQEEVLFLLAKGRTAQFIADKLTITLATSKSHIYNIYIKFGVHSQQELLDLLESEDN